MKNKPASPSQKQGADTTMTTGDVEVPGMEQLLALLSAIVVRVLRQGEPQ